LGPKIARVGKKKKATASQSPPGKTEISSGGEEKGKLFVGGPDGNRKFISGTSLPRGDDAVAPSVAWRGKKRTPTPSEKKEIEVFPQKGRRACVDNMPEEEKSQGPRGSSS